MIIKTRFKRAFSLIELLISLIVISCITAAFTPIITKKFSSGVFGGGGSSSGWSDECKDISTDCKLCYKDNCIMCSIESCPSGQYRNLAKCKCIDCSIDYGADCLTCDSDGCLSCNEDKYPNGNTCTNCDTKYPNCATCDETKCKTCKTNYKLDNGVCVPDCTKFFNENCTSCDELSCKSCKPNYDLVGNDCIANCPTKFGQNCLACTASACTSCKNGYAPKNGTCQSCSSIFSNCTNCTTSACTACKSGYNLKNNTCVQDCTRFGTNCTSCTSSSCTECTNGYVVSENPSSSSACEAFSCSGPNFLQIDNLFGGRLCMTKRNMGDASALTISGARVVNVGTNCSSSSSNPCCWKGTTADECGFMLGIDYTGCNRTVCDHYAAEKICANYKAGGKIWRLPSPFEMISWDNTMNTQLCDAIRYASLEQCQDTGNVARCLGSKGPCNPSHVWTNETNGSSEATHYEMLDTYWYTYTDDRSETASVRCVTNL